MVPDTAAHRLFFLTAGKGGNASPKAKELQKAILAPLGLSDTELTVVTRILDQFKDDYARIVGEYNATVQAANKTGASADVKGFLLDRDRLVESTYDAITSAISKEAVTRFETHLNSEKRRMKASKDTP